jgi:hypothetical protein
MNAEKMIKVLVAGKAGTDWTANSSAHDDLMAWRDLSGSPLTTSPAFTCWICGLCRS